MTEVRKFHPSGAWSPGASMIEAAWPSRIQRALRRSAFQREEGCSDCGPDFKPRPKPLPALAVVRTPSEPDVGAATMAPPSVHAVLATPGRSLEPDVRDVMERRFRHDFGSVRIHTGTTAAASADEMGANAYTVGRHVVFGGEYAPRTPSGFSTLTHELTHVAQQATGGSRQGDPIVIGSPMDALERRAEESARSGQFPGHVASAPAYPDPGPRLQRDLKAYNEPRSESVLADPQGVSSQFIDTTAEAPGIRKALAALIASGKVKEVASTDGRTSWFAAEHHKNVQLADIELALTAAGYAMATGLAKAIYDIHGEFLYTNRSITTIGPFFSRTTKLGERIENQANRSMTEWEIRQARRVFGDALDYSKITIKDGSISAKVGSVGGYARTVGNTIHFPAGGSRNMEFMVHELTHAWQYQTTGWSYAPKAIWAQMTEGYAYTDGGKSPEQSLLDARAAGKTLLSYNKEQQGDILSDYFRRLQQGKDVAAWLPFVQDIPGR